MLPLAILHEVKVNSPMRNRAGGKKVKTEEKPLAITSPYEVTKHAPSGPDFCTQ